VFQDIDIVINLDIDDLKEKIRDAIIGQITDELCIAHIAKRDNISGAAAKEIFDALTAAEKAELREQTAEALIDEAVEAVLQESLGEELAKLGWGSRRISDLFEGIDIKPTVIETTSGGDVQRGDEISRPGADVTTPGTEMALPGVESARQGAVPEVIIDTTDLSNWKVADHYDSGFYGNYDWNSGLRPVNPLTATPPSANPAAGPNTFAHAGGYSDRVPNFINPNWGTSNIDLPPEQWLDIFDPGRTDPNIGARNSLRPFYTNRQPTMVVVNPNHNSMANSTLAADWNNAANYRIVDLCWEDFKDNPLSLPNNSMPRMTLETWLNTPDSQKPRTDRDPGRFPNAVTLGTFDRHILSRMVDGKPRMDFVGYAHSQFNDFALYQTDRLHQPALARNAKKVTFDVDGTQVNAHSLYGAGFLVNFGIHPDTDIIQGYVLHYIYTSSAAARPTQLHLYRITRNDLTAEAFHGLEHGRGGGETNPNLTAMFGPNSLIANIPITLTNWWEQMSVELEITPTTLRMWQYPLGDEAARVQILNQNLPVESLYNGFGPTVSYRSHGCPRATVFTYSNLYMEILGIEGITARTQETVREDTVTRTDIRERTDTVTEKTTRITINSDNLYTRLLNKYTREYLAGNENARLYFIDIADNGVGRTDLNEDTPVDMIIEEIITVKERAVQTTAVIRRVDTVITRIEVEYNFNDGMGYIYQPNLTFVPNHPDPRYIERGTETELNSVTEQIGTDTVISVTTRTITEGLIVEVKRNPGGDIVDITRKEIIGNAVYETVTDADGNVISTDTYPLSELTDYNFAAATDKITQKAADFMAEHNIWYITNHENTFLNDGGILGADTTPPAPLRQRGKTVGGEFGAVGNINIAGLGEYVNGILGGIISRVTEFIAENIPLCYNGINYMVDDVIAYGSYERVITPADPDNGIEAVTETVSGRESGISINLSQEKFAIDRKANPDIPEGGVYMFSVDGGIKWRIPRLEFTDSMRFARLLQRGMPNLIIAIGTPPSGKLRTPPADAFMVSFAEIQRPDRLLRYSINYAIYPAEFEIEKPEAHGARPQGAWALSTGLDARNLAGIQKKAAKAGITLQEAMGDDSTVLSAQEKEFISDLTKLAVNPANARNRDDMQNILVGAARVGPNGRPMRVVDSRGYGVFCISDGIPVSVTGNSGTPEKPRHRPLRTTYFIRTAAEEIRDEDGNIEAYRAAGRPRRVAATGQQRAPNNRVNFAAQSVVMRPGSMYSTDYGATWTTVAQKGYGFNISEAVAKGLQLWIKRAPTIRRPESVTQIIHFTNEEGNLPSNFEVTVVNGKITSNMRVFDIRVGSRTDTETGEVLPPEENWLKGVPSNALIEQQKPDGFEYFTEAVLDPGTGDIITEAAVHAFTAVFDIRMKATKTSPAGTEAQTGRLEIVFGRSNAANARERPAIISARIIAP
jgi:hypothetical protein